MNCELYTQPYKCVDPGVFFLPPNVRWDVRVRYNGGGLGVPGTGPLSDPPRVDERITLVLHDADSDEVKTHLADGLNHLDGLTNMPSAVKSVLAEGLSRGGFLPVIVKMSVGEAQRLRDELTKIIEQRKQLDADLAA